MEKHSESYSKDQIDDAEKLCQLIQKVPDEKRQMVAAVVTAYIDGIEAGLRMAREEKERKVMK